MWAAVQNDEMLRDVWLLTDEPHGDCDAVDASADDRDGYISVAEIQHVSERTGSKFKRIVHSFL